MAFHGLAVVNAVEGARVGSAAETGAHERVQITGIAAGGAGVGRLADGRAIFVERTAPGDLVDVVLTQQQRRWARGRIARILIRGEGRVDPPCVHYGRCGGCALQHLGAETQRHAKAQLVVDALQRIGGIRVPTPDVVASPRPFAYRNRVSFTLRRVAQHVIAGFHELERPDRVVDIDARCLLPEEPILRVWQQLREAWGPGAALLPAGDELRLTLRAGSEGDVLLLIEGGTGSGGAAELCARVPGLEAVWHVQPPGSTPRRLAGKVVLSDQWNGRDVGLAGASFVQVNREAARMLDAHVLERIGTAAGQRVIDAYCGTGVRTARLAELGADVVGIDLDGHAIARARAWGSDAQFRAGRVEELLAGLLPAELVVLNPPRQGLHADVCGLLQATPPARVIYVSCDPATLARDLARMRGALAVRSVRCFDLFPQTAHIETVVELTCATT